MRTSQNPLLAATLLLSACSSSSGPIPLTARTGTVSDPIDAQAFPLPTDHVAIQNRIDTLTLALEKGDLDEVMSSYDARGSAVLFDPGQPMKDANAQRSKFQELLSLKVKFTYGEHEIIQTGSIAVHTSPWSMHATAPDGTPIAQSGLSIAVLRKLEDGSWRVVIDNPHGQRLLDQSETHSAGTPSKVSSVVDRMTAKLVEGDIDGVMAVYDNAGSNILFQPGTPVSQPEQQRQMFEDLAQSGVIFTMSTHEVIEVGSLALHISPWTMSATAPDGTPIEDSGLSVAVLRRLEDESWRMVIDNPHGSRLL